MQCNNDSRFHMQYPVQMSIDLSIGFLVTASSQAGEILKINSITERSS